MLFRSLILSSADEYLQRILFWVIYFEHHHYRMTSSMMGYCVTTLEACLSYFENLKEKFDPQSYDYIRAALGLEPLQEAVKKGMEVTENVRNTVSNKKIQNEFLKNAGFGIGVFSDKKDTE